MYKFWNKYTNLTKMNSIKLDKETFTWVTKLNWRDGNSFTIYYYYFLMFYDSTSQAKSVTLVYGCN